MPISTSIASAIASTVTSIVTRACPAASLYTAMSALPALAGVVAWDQAQRRLFSVPIQSTASFFAAQRSTAFSAAQQMVQMVRYDAVPALLSILPLRAGDDVFALQYDAPRSRLLALVRNAATTSLNAVNPSGTTVGNTNSVLLDLTPQVGSVPMLRALSAFDPSAQKFYFVWASSATSTLQLQQIDLNTLLVTVAIPLSGLASLSGMTFVPGSSKLLWINYQGAWTYDAIAGLQLLTSVPQAIQAVTAAAGQTSPSAFQTAMYLSGQLWDPANDANGLPSHLVPMLVQTAASMAPILLLIDAVADSVSAEPVPNSFARKTAAIPVIATVPSIQSVSPSVISPEAGAMVTVTGSDFFAFPTNRSATCFYNAGMSQVAARIVNNTALVCRFPTELPRSMETLDLQIQFSANTTLVAVPTIGKDSHASSTARLQELHDSLALLGISLLGFPCSPFRGRYQRVQASQW
jgi:hypothetical protein